MLAPELQPSFGEVDCELRSAVVSAIGRVYERPSGDMAMAEVRLKPKNVGERADALLGIKRSLVASKRQTKTVESSSLT